MAIVYGPFGYTAHLNDLADEIRKCRQQVRDFTGRRDVLGWTTTKTGVPIDDCIAAWQARLEKAEAAYERARAEATEA